ncbi:hypothetical protein [Kitasatospora sp. NPDC101183]|uniref:hypothetical protein n=1 Tax=Kitasatospora sp. NPDC101183 TaxID=3364100 RepID=UPI00381ACE3D
MPIARTRRLAVASATAALAALSLTACQEAPGPDAAPSPKAPVGRTADHHIVRHLPRLLLPR